ncbi:hypothetical protein ABTN34_18810, partial [Acinetobacter baumannii]
LHFARSNCSPKRSARRAELHRIADMRILQHLSADLVVHVPELTTEPASPLMSECYGGKKQRCFCGTNPHPKP